MGAIEELMYEAYELGIEEEVMKEASKLRILLSIGTYLYQRSMKTHLIML